MAQSNKSGGMSSMGSSSSSGGTMPGAAAGFNRDKAIETLNDLLVVDYNAVGLYDKVLEKLGASPHKNTVNTFKSDHERHIRDLSQSIKTLGGTPRTEGSFMGPISKALTTVTSAVMGEKGALQGLLQGEEYTTTSYNNANLNGFPQDLRDLVMKNRQDEERHLQWVKETLKSM